MLTKTMSIVYGQERINFIRQPRTNDVNRVLINIYPDCSVIAKAPVHASDEDVVNAVKKRARWIHNKLVKFKEQKEHVLQRQYVSGESHFYMGRRYKLKIIKVCKMEPSVKLYRGCIEIRVKDKSSISIKKQLTEWYRERAAIVFDTRINMLSDKISWLKVPPSWKLILMKKQWGSCSPKGVISLNPNLIKAPRECIDYVITHEICHLKEHNHSPSYYRLLSQYMIGWESIKVKLDGMSEFLLNE